MGRTHTRRIGVVAVFGALCAVFAPAVANAAPEPSQHCIGDLDTGEMFCGSTKEEARALHPESKAWTVHVILYDETGYGGDDLELGSDITSCTTTTSDTEGSARDLGDFGWDNRASSFVTRNNCDVKLYDGVGFTGDSTQYLDHALDLRERNWNNRASSYKIS